MQYEYKERLSKKPYNKLEGYTIEIPLNWAT